MEISRAGMSICEAGTFDDIRLKTHLKIIDGLEISQRDSFQMDLNETKTK